MNMRQFTITAVALMLFVPLQASSVAPAAEAAQTWTEGVEYERIDPPMPIQVPAGKIEVIEFFAYWCPHCKDLQVPLEEWKSRAPADVVLRRVPIIWKQEQVLGYARLYYTLERLGRFDLHSKFFKAIDEHRNDHGNILQQTADHVAFAVANGIPEQQFVEIYDSEAVSASVAAAQAAVADYKILYAPTIVVQGTYRANGRALSRGGQELLQLVDEVVAKVRRQKFQAREGGL